MSCDFSDLIYNQSFSVKWFLYKIKPELLTNLDTHFIQQLHGKPDEATSAYAHIDLFLLHGNSYLTNLQAKDIKTDLFGCLFLFGQIIESETGTTTNPHEPEEEPSDTTNIRYNKSVLCEFFTAVYNILQRVKTLLSWLIDAAHEDQDFDFLKPITPLISIFIDIHLKPILVSVSVYNLRVNIERL